MIPQAKPYTAESGMRCTGSAYTFNPSTGCDGWSQLSEYECWEKCSTNAQASNCPAKTCTAAAFYPSSGWCHLYDTCASTDVASGTILLKAISCLECILQKCEGGRGRPGGANLGAQSEAFWGSPGLPRWAPTVPLFCCVSRSVSLSVSFQISRVSPFRFT